MCSAYVFLNTVYCVCAYELTHCMLCIDMYICFVYGIL